MRTWATRLSKDGSHAYSFSTWQREGYRHDAMPRTGTWWREGRGKDEEKKEEGKYEEKMRRRREEEEIKTD